MLRISTSSIRTAGPAGGRYAAGPAPACVDGALHPRRGPRAPRQTSLRASIGTRDKRLVGLNPPEPRAAAFFAYKCVPGQKRRLNACHARSTGYGFQCLVPQHLELEL